MPGVALRQPTDHKPSATHHAVFRQRLDGVIRTSRVEPAARPQKRAQRPLINPDEDHADLFHVELSGNRSCNETRQFFTTGGRIARRATQLDHHVASRAAALSATPAERLPDHTLKGVACDRSLDQAFCDDEAQAVVRESVGRSTYDEPLPAVPLAPHRRAKLRWRMQTPMRRKPSWRRRRRFWAQELEAEQSGLDRQPLATLCATGIQDLATTQCLHSGAEAVRAGAANLRGLISALHVLTP
jgi:hypothetical protein